MSKPQKFWTGKDTLNLIVGAILMVGGVYVSTKVHLDFLDKLAESGILFDPGKTLAILGVFLILFPVIRLFFIAPLAEAITNRTTELERTFGEAEELRSEMTKMRNEYEQRLAATEAAAREQIQSEVRIAQELAQTLRAEAASQVEQLKQRAQQEIEQDKNRVMNELRLEVVNLTLSATERILGENMDTDKNRRLVQDFIDKVEVPG